MSYPRTCLQRLKVSDSTHIFCGSFPYSALPRLCAHAAASSTTCPTSPTGNEVSPSVMVKAPPRRSTAVQERSNRVGYNTQRQNKCKDIAQHPQSSGTCHGARRTRIASLAHLNARHQVMMIPPHFSKHISGVFPTRGQNTFIRFQTIVVPLRVAHRVST